MKAFFSLLLVLVVTEVTYAQSFVRIGKYQLQKVNNALYVVEGKSNYLVDEKTITLKIKAPNDVSSLLRKYNLSIIRKSITGFIDLSVQSKTDFIDLVQTLTNEPIVESLDINTRGSYNVNPNDPQFGNQWFLSQIGMPDVWNMVRGQTCITIAVIDSGLDIAHEDIGTGMDTYNSLWNNPGEDAWTNVDNPATGDGIDNDGNGLIDDWRGWDFDAGTNDVRSPGVNHGTLVSGIVAAKANNSRGVAGIGGGFGSAGFRIMLVGSGDATPNTLAIDDAILYAVARGANVIQMSLSVAFSTAIENAIAVAVANGVPVVCASGNNGAAVSYPANNPNVIAVGSTNSGDAMSAFSNHGTELFISAPGENIRSTTLASTYGDDSGTSFSAPQVSAVIGLIRQINPALTINQIRALLASTADKTGGYNYNWDASRPGHSLELGFGRLNARRAVEQALGAPLAGPGLICSDGTFSLTGTPPGSVSWSSSNSGILTINSSGYATRVGSASGSVTITATIANGCGNATLTQTVWVGAPSYVVSVDGVNTNTAYVSAGSFHSLNAATLSPGATTYNYTDYTGSGDMSISLSPSGSYAYLYVNSSSTTGYREVTVSGTNTCGTLNQSLYLYLSGMFKAYPNPAKSELTLAFSNAQVKETLPSEISLFAEQSTVPVMTISVWDYYDKKMFKDGDKISLDVSALPRGTYYLHTKNSQKQDNTIDRIRVILE